jgi:gas vesicle protein
MESDNRSTMLWFLCGIAAGAISTLLLAPETSERTRRSLVEQGERVLNGSGRELFNRGRELYERGREIAEDAAELFERNRKLPQDALESGHGRETV